MNKNGFTLIELIAIIVIIGIVALITIPTVTSVINNARENLTDQQIKTIELSAKKWGLDNIDRLPTDETTTGCVSLNTLQSLGYLDNDIINPTNNEVMEGSVKITYLKDYKQYEYEYQQTSC